MAEKTNYAHNTVMAKLHGLVGSPIEMVLGTAMFEHMSRFYQDWWCRVYSNAEFKAMKASDIPNAGSVIAIVPQFAIEGVGRVDFGLFVPQLERKFPLVVVECDGHEFHERTAEQASKDKRRDRGLTAAGIRTLRFTGVDILRESASAASEIAEIFDAAADALEERWWLTVGNEVNKAGANPAGGMYVPYQWPRSRIDGKHRK